MHQDNFRSAVFRSLTKTSPVLFEDGVGAVRDKTAAKTKASSSSSSGMEFAAGRSHRRRDLVPFGFEEEGNAIMHRGSNELQLSRVSEGAHSLTHMINDWFKEPTAGIESAAFAQNLLRGALDLQESLIMLEKLRASSTITSRLNQERKDECHMGNRYEEDISIQNLCSKHYGVVRTSPNRLQDMGLLGDDGSSRSSLEEMTQTIKDSLHKQSLLSPSSDDEKVSSSRSLGFSPSNRFDDKYNDHNAVPAYSVGAADLSKKAKTRNLIAKLMGLDEEVPPETFQTSKDEKMKGSYSLKSGLNIEMPKGRKMQVLEENNDAKKSLDEIIQTMHLKGLLKRNKLEEEEIQPTFFASEELKQKYQKEFEDGEHIAPPIVIMRPMHYARRDAQMRGEVLLDKASMKEVFQMEKSMQELNRCGEGAVLTKMFHQREVDHMGANRIAPCSNGRSLASALKDQRDKISLAQRKPKSQPNPSTMAEKKQVEKVVKSMQMSTSNCRNSTAMPRPDKRLNQARTEVYSQVRAPQNQLKSSRTDIHSQIRVPQSQLKSSLKPAQRASTSLTKVKTASKATAVQRSRNINTVSHDGNNRQRKAVKPWNQASEASTASKIASYDIFKQTEKTCPSYYKDNTRKDHRLACEVMPKINHAGASSRLAEEATLLPDCRRNLDAVAESQSEIALVLLSSHSFIASTKEHFGFDLKHPCHENKVTKKLGKQGDKLFLDLAEELMARKSCYHKDITRSLLQSCQSCRSEHLSLDQLVAEISTGIGKLASYSAVAGTACENSLYMRLERDLSCTDFAINSVWDIGWGNWMCMEEAGKLVSEVGDSILSRLIEEATLQLIY